VSVKLAADSRSTKRSTSRRASLRVAGLGTRSPARAAIGELEKRLEEKTEALRREVTGKLENKLGDLRTELDQAIGRATVAALTEPAPLSSDRSGAHERRTPEMSRSK